ncbi:nitrogen regulatory IIA protein [Flavobacterium procerum]|uniref:Nitrogen regulatory IIA protein n=1 Tax=Flavobacterium procerum TaxID=1455569 RepID=A0ABV6BQS0_9FLAO
MKKLRADIDQWLDRLDRNWEAMPVKRQRQIIMYFFAVYALLSAAVIFNVCRSAAQTGDSLAVEYIHTPSHAEKKSHAEPQDSLKPILKK